MIIRVLLKYVHVNFQIQKSGTQGRDPGSLSMAEVPGPKLEAPIVTYITRTYTTSEGGSDFGAALS